MPVTDDGRGGRTQARTPVDPQDSQAVAREVAELVEERSGFCNCAVQDINLYRYEVEARIAALRRLRAEAGTDTREIEMRLQDAERERDALAQGNTSFGSGGNSFGGGTFDPGFGGPANGSVGGSVDAQRQAETCRSLFAEFGSEQAAARGLDSIVAACGQSVGSQSFGGPSGAQAPGQGALAPPGNRRWIAHFVEAEARFNDCLLRASNNVRTTAACNALTANPFGVEGCVRAYMDARIYAEELADLCLEQSPISTTGTDPGVTATPGPGPVLL